MCRKPSPRGNCSPASVVLRRMENAGLPEGSDRQDGMLCMHGLCMNPQTLKVTLNNEPLDLTSMEFQLLYHLARGAGRIFSREDLLNLFAEKEWNKFDRCVDVHISSLRKKLGDNSRCPTYLKTVRGLGYMFIKQSDAWP
ncbi:MAG: winged helix-turn-helix domain-containing protein [Bilophila wadsworthia]